ncbi:MAG: MOSC domain-containing protein [Candidatus Eremiobacterota bacterium]
MARIIAVCISKEKGTAKKEIPEGILIENFGLKEDAHGGPWHRQVSLLASESIEKIRNKGIDLPSGVFGENIVTEGIELISLPVGTKLKLGNTAICEVTQIGKECHSPCIIYHTVGDCIMPREGIFVRILSGGTIKHGDNIEIVKNI